MSELDQVGQYDLGSGAARWSASSAHAHPPVPRPVTPLCHTALSHRPCTRPDASQVATSSTAFQPAP